MTRHLQPMHRGEKGNSQHKAGTGHIKKLYDKHTGLFLKKHLGYVNTPLRGNRFNTDKGLDLPWNLGRSIG